MKPLLTFYGDDFTGSTAVMEVLSFAGVSTMSVIRLQTLTKWDFAKFCSESKAFC